MAAKPTRIVTVTGATGVQGGAVPLTPFPIPLTMYD